MDMENATETVDPEVLWQEVEATLRAHYHKPDVQAARVLFSAVAAHLLPGPPVWVMLVAPPGSLKTELLKSLDGFPKVHQVDQVTTNTFLSGQIGTANRRPVGLLHRIGKDAILVFPDFSTVLGMRRETRGEILAQLRRMYDGKFRREFGHRGGDPPWEGRIMLIVATTGAVDVYYSVFQTLGERFVMVRWHRPGGEEAALEAMNQDTAGAPEELRKAVKKLFEGRDYQRPRLPSRMQRKVAALAEFAVRARTHVLRTGYHKEITYVPEAEAPTRLAQQLAQLVRGSAMLAGRAVANEEDYRVALRAGLDSIPDTKRKILEVLMHGDSLERVSIPDSTRTYALEDLRELGLVKETRLSPCAARLVEKFKI